MINANENDSIIAGIITFNPDIEILKKSIESLLSQNLSIVIVDNASSNYNMIEMLISNSFANEKIIVIRNNINKGIADALNKAMEYAFQHNVEWVLTLDQDSICPQNYVESMRRFFYVEPKIAIVAPLIVDRNVGIVGHKTAGDYGFVRTCITSGAFTKVENWKSVGGFDAAMFIDSVDFEYCFRIRKAGYKVLQTSKVRLSHSLGDAKSVKVLGKKIRISGHSALRCFYIAQNNIYYPLKHNLWLHLIRGNLRNLRKIVMVVLFENDKKNKIISTIKGWKNGYLLRKERKHI